MQGKELIPAVELVKQRKIRLILNTNHLTSLFMSAWFRQNKFSEQSDTQTFLVYTHPYFLDSSSDNYDEEKRMNQINYKMCQLPWEGISLPWISLQIDKALYPSSHFYHEYQKRKTLFEGITSWFSNHPISPYEVCEIWYTSEFFRAYLFDLCTHAQGISFEHSLSEVHIQLSSCRSIIQPIQKPMLQQCVSHSKNKAIRLLFQLISQFSSFLSRFPRFSFFSLFIKNEFIKRFSPYERMHVGLLSDEIHSGECKIPQGNLDPVRIKQYITQIMKNDESTSFLQSLEGNTAVILINHMNGYGLSHEEHLEYYQMFEKYIVSQWEELFEKYHIKNIVFKAQLFNECFFSDAIDSFFDLKTKYKIFEIASLSKNNYAFEFYLHACEPVLLFGAFSSGLIYSKKMNPHLTTFTYHEWVIHYMMERLHMTNHPFDSWLPREFESDFRDNFKRLLPEKAPYNSDNSIHTHMEPKIN